MARINIDDELHAEKGFKRLVRLLGNQDLAIGLLYRFWWAAQDYWGDECKLMPLKEFQAEGFGPILECELAEIRDNGVYAKGAEERFDWYLQRVRASKAAIRAREEKLNKNSGSDRNPSSGPPEQASRSTGTTPPDNPLTPVPAPAPVTVTVTVPAPAPVPVPAPVPARARILPRLKLVENTPKPTAGIGSGIGNGDRLTPQGGGIGNGERREKNAVDPNPLVRGQLDAIMSTCLRRCGLAPPGGAPRPGGDP